MKTHSVVPKDLGYTLTVSSDLSRLCCVRDGSESCLSCSYVIIDHLY